MVAGAAIAAAALALAGCSGGGAEASGDTIRLGVMGDHTAQVNSYSGIPRVIELAVEQVNADGGIGGVPVEIVECDLQGVPDQATRCARKMMDEGVTAVLAQVAFGVEKIPPVFEEAKIAYLPAYTLSQIDMESPASFPVVPGVLSQMGGGWLSADGGCENPVVVSVQSPSSDFMEELATLGAEAGGGVAPRFVMAPLNATDYAPIAAEAVADNPDCILPYMSESLNSVFYPALEQTGWKDQGENNRLLGYQGGVYTQAILEEFPELMEGMRAVDMSRPFNSDIWTDFNAMIEQLSDDGLTNLTSSFTKHSYINFLAWVDAVKQTQDAGADVTNETVFDTFGESDAISTSDFTAPFSTKNFAGFERWPRLFNTSLIVEEFKDGEVVELNDGEFVDIGPDLAEVVG